MSASDGMNQLESSLAQAKTAKSMSEYPNLKRVVARARFITLLGVLSVVVGFFSLFNSGNSSRYADQGAQATTFVITLVTNLVVLVLTGLMVKFSNDIIRNFTETNWTELEAAMNRIGKLFGVDLALAIIFGLIDLVAGAPGGTLICAVGAIIPIVALVDIKKARVELAALTQKVPMAS